MRTFAAAFLTTTLPCSFTAPVRATAANKTNKNQADFIAVAVKSQNTAEGWARDVSEDVVDEIRRRCDQQMTEVPATLQEFVERHEARVDRRQLRLV